MEDRIVEIARFMQTTEAEMLANLFQSEGINCYVRDGISSQVLFGRADIGGAKVELLEKDVLRAAEIMKDHGYAYPEELVVSIVSRHSDADNAAYEQSKTRLARFMTLIIVLMVIVFITLVLLNTYFKQ